VHAEIGASERFVAEENGKTPAMTSITADAILVVIQQELDAMEIDADSLTSDTVWQQANIDSIEIIELASTLEDRYKIEFDNATLRGLVTVGELVQAIETLVRAGDSSEA
jgi:acyl carrier protein